MRGTPETITVRFSDQGPSKDLVRTVNVEHHLPVGGPDALVKPEPDLPAPAEWVVAAARGGEERPADGGVPTTFNQNLQQPFNHAGKM